MFMVMSPTYKMTVTIKDRLPQQQGNMMSAQGVAMSIGSEPKSPYKFADMLHGKTGCDEALAAVKDALSKAGLEAEVFFDQFSHTA
jgi:hypothetical protein